MPPKATFYRTAELRVERADETDPVIRVALSSEHPVERAGMFGDHWREILAHDASAVDLARFARGLPLLVDHDTRELVGRLHDPELGEDGVLRAVARFGRSARAQEIRQDVLDGIRTDMSIGYQIDPKSVKRERTEDEDVLVVRAMRWMPLEGSIVAVPADHTVGVGRSLEAAEIAAAPAPAAEEGSRMESKAPTTATAPGEGAGAVKVTFDPAEERARVQGLRELAKTHGRVVTEKDLDKWIESGITVDGAARDAIEKYVSAPLPTNAADIPDKDLREYSLSRALLAAAEGDFRGKAPFEAEVHDALARASRKENVAGTRGGGVSILVPMNFYQRGAHEVATASKGGELKFTEPGPFIEIFRNKMFVRALGARLLTGLQGDIQFPRQATAHSASWVGESPTADLSESNLTLNNLNLAPKLLSATTSYTRKLLAQGVRDIDALIREDFAAVLALEVDKQAINGPGTSGIPTGILNTSGIGSVAGGTNGAAPTYDHFVDLETELAVDNADMGALAYLTTPQVRGKMKKQAQISATTGIPAWFGGEINGFRAEASNQVPSNLTKGTSTTIAHAILFGNWSEVLIGQWGDLEVVVDPYTQARRGNILITPYLMVDVGLRHVTSFSAMKDALP